MEDKRFCTEGQQTFPDLNTLFISSCMEFWYFKCVPNIWTVPPFKTIYYLSYVVIFSACWFRDTTTYLVSQQ